MVGICTMSSRLLSRGVTPKLNIYSCKSYHFNLSRLSLSTLASVKYYKHGVPENVLRLEESNESLLPGKGQIRLAFLACPVNPADINMIEGSYGLLPQLPAVAGNEGVAVVDAVGPDVKRFNVGDWVIPSEAGFGTWRSKALANERLFTPVPKNIPLELAATIAVNPCTAYRMLHDFVDLQEGDVVVQNGASSSVAQAVIQIAAAKGIKTVNIVRERGDMKPLMSHLKSLGADIIVTESGMKSQSFKTIIKELPSAKLALNCIGGSIGTQTAFLLGDGGTYVTYGAMSREPLKIPTGLFIFKNINFRGYWMTRWVKEHSEAERVKMLEILAGFATEGKLKASVEFFKIQDFAKAVDTAQQGLRTHKVVLRM